MKYNTSNFYTFRLIVLVLLLGLIVSCAGTGSKKGIEYSKGGALSDIIEDFSGKHANLRIAVMDFTNTGGSKTRFDGYIADSLVTELSRKKFTVLERKRLRSVLDEYALKQSGVVSSTGAVKLGKFLPVDALATGSYTVIGNRIEINGRFIHVVSGKIIYAFSGVLNVDPGEIRPPSDGGRKQTVCDSVHGPVLAALKNLKSTDDIKLAVERSLAVPFDAQCGMVHENVMYSFAKYNIYPETYKNFLIDTITSIENPSQDRRASLIMHYFSSDKKVDSEEWSASITALKRATVWTSRRYLLYMLNNRYEDSSVVKKRIDEIMALALSEKIGKPVALTADRIFFDITSALKNRDKPNPDVFNYTFRKYINAVPDDEKNNRRALGIIRSAYSAENEKDHLRKSQIKTLDLIIDFFKSRNVTEKLTEDLFRIIRDVENRINPRYKRKGHVAAHYETDLEKINKSLAPVICRSYDSLVKTGGEHNINKRKEYILRHSVMCKGGPSLNSLIADMQSRDWKRKISAAEMFSKLGTGAAGAEKTIIKYLGQKGFGRDGGRMRYYLAKTLGNIKTNNPKGINALIDSFAEYGNSVSSESKDSIKKIGVSALPYLIKGLYHKEKPVRYGCTEALGNLGASAKKALPALRRLADSDKDSYVRKRAKESIQMIVNDY